MKGCIIKNNEITIKDVYNIIGDADNYNWLITNIELSLIHISEPTRH